MKRFLPTFLVAAFLIGCNSTQLRFSTLRLTTTVPDIQQVQVLDNLARLSADPGVLPYYTVITNGTANVTDRGKASGFLTYPAQTVVKQLHQQRGGQLGPLSGERDITGNWSLKPLNDPNRLAAMRCACQIALGMTDQIHPVDFERLKVFLKINYKGCDLQFMSSVNDVSGIPKAGKSLIIVADVNDVLHFRIFNGDGEVVVDTDETRLTGQDPQIADLKNLLESLRPTNDEKTPVLTNEEKVRVVAAVTSIVGYSDYKAYNGNPMEVIPSGWTCRGTKWEVPKHWPYVANCGAVYVWVKPDRVRDFTNFVFIYLDLATLSAVPRRDLPDVSKTS